MVKNIKLLFYFFPVIIAFLLPFGNAITSPFIALWFITSFFCFKDLVIANGWKNLWFISTLLFFGITTISNFIFYNPNDALSAIEVKLTFLLFPFLFFMFKFNSDVAKRVIVAFVSGCMFACVFCIARAFAYLFKGDSSYFYYSNFSFFMHSAYFAMYLNLAVVFVILFYFKWFKNAPSFKYIAFGFITLFLLCILLCASKMGIITLFILLPSLLIMELRNRIKLKHYLIGITSAVIISVSIYAVFPQVFDHLRSVAVVTNKNIDKTAMESSSVRVLIWDECTKIIKENMLFGVGVSKANETLYAGYKMDGLTGALEGKLNAHNQFFQTSIGMGIIGLLNLLLLTLGLTIYGLRKKRNLIFFFSTLITCNFLVESMLQTSAGTVFFVFFLCFLNVFYKIQFNEENSK
ncbi:MAG: O-antigen ligase family protein [Sphingobacteriaceae bacterium]|nr:O-antigen ligase family protein [Sphingobacteriaceae bacterium]